MKKIALSALAVFFLLPARVVLAADIQVIAVVGTATVDGKKIRSGDAIKVNEIIETAKDSGVKIRLGDRTVIDIAANSVFRVESVRGGNKEETVTKLEKGGAKAAVPSNSAVKASVIKSLQQKPKFYMKTKWSVIAVRGTRFYVLSPENEEEPAGVGVRQGAVVLLSADGRQTIREITAGNAFVGTISQDRSRWKMLPAQPEEVGAMDVNLLEGTSGTGAETAVMNTRMPASVPTVTGGIIASLSNNAQSQSTTNSSSIAGAAAGASLFKICMYIDGQGANAGCPAPTRQ